MTNWSNLLPLVEIFKSELAKFSKVSSLNFQKKFSKVGSIEYKFLKEGARRGGGAFRRFRGKGMPLGMAERANALSLSRAFIFIYMCIYIYVYASLLLSPLSEIQL